MLFSSVLKCATSPICCWNYEVERQPSLQCGKDTECTKNRTQTSTCPTFISYGLKPSAWTSSEIIQAVIIIHKDSKITLHRQLVILQSIQSPNEHNKADFTVRSDEEWGGEGVQKNRRSSDCLPAEYRQANYLFNLFSRNLPKGETVQQLKIRSSLQCSRKFSIQRLKPE